MRDGPPLLQIKNLKVQFTSKEGTVKAVDDLSFEVYPEEVLGIVGESGCGKSVTALSILNVLSRNGKIAAGNILLRQGEETIDIAQLGPDGAAMRAIQGNEIAMIFQEPMTAFSPLHTIGNQIGEAIELHMHDSQQAVGQPSGQIPMPAVPRRRGPFGGRAVKHWVDKQTIEILRKVGMPNPEEILHAFPHNLSGGMRQRAMIAMALSCNPRILIADEPTTALDVTLQAQALALMRQMQALYHMSIIFITHDLGVIAEMADRVVVMYLGRVMETATVDDLFYQPKHPYTQALIQSVPKTSGPLEKLIPIEGTVPSSMDMPKGCKFHTRCPQVMPGLCDVNAPQLLEVASGHQVACFLYNEGGPP